MPLLGLGTVTIVALVAGAIVAAAFVGALIAIRLRGRPQRGPDIPPGMKPGPADEVLERRHLESVMGWGVAFTLLFALAVAYVFLQEPVQNRADAVELIDRSVERGELWFRVAGEENPTGFGCEQCHGEEGTGGEQIPFTTPDGETRFVPPPPLNDVCARLPIEGPGGIRETIMQGRPGTPMPSWSVRFAGPMNDQQIQDLINYIVSIQTVKGEANKCLNPPTGTDAPGDQPSPAPGDPAAGPSPGVNVTPSPEGGGGGGGSPQPKASPTQGEGGS